MLEIDGKKLAQSFAIARFLARKYGTFSILFISEQPCRRTQKLGFAGKNAFDEALVDSIADQLRDYVVEIRPFYKVAMGFEEGDLVRGLPSPSTSFSAFRSSIHLTLSSKPFLNSY